MELKFLTEIKHHKIRGLKTLITCLSCLCIGYQGSIAGVSLMDLKVLASCTLSEISLIITGGCIGYASGSVVAGFLESKLNPQLVLAFSAGIAGISQLGYAFTTNLGIMIFLSITSGFFCGVISCVSNVFILKMWAKESPPFLQAHDFFYGIGSFVAPLVAGPYLKEVSGQSSDSNSSTLANLTVNPLKPEDIQLYVPYGVNTGCNVVVMVAFLLVYIKYPETSDHPSRSEVADAAQTSENVTTIKKLNPSIRILVILMAATFLLFYTGLEQTFGHMLPTYAHDGPPGVTKETGAKIASVFWITYTCFRLKAIILSGVMGPVSMIVFNTIFTIIASIVLCAAQTNVPAFWFSSAFLGVGLSSTWGALFGYLESQFPVRGKIVATMTVGASIGAAVTPAVIGYLMGLHIESFAWFPLVLSFVIAIIFLLIFLTCKLHLYIEVKTERKEFKSQISVVSQQSIGAVIFVAKDIKT